MDRHDPLVHGCGETPSPQLEPGDLGAAGQTPALQREPFAIPPDGGPAVWFLGSLAQVKATVAGAGPRWGAIVVTAAPGYAPAPHIHHREDESFYVLEGEMTFLLGDRWIDASRGSFVLVPGGTTHTFQNRSDERAGILNFGVPGDFEKEMPAISAWFEANPPGRV